MRSGKGVSRAAEGAVDAVVVGAGLSGLICARELHRRGLSVRLLEARRRCGGRMLGQRSSSGLRLDLGGQWVGASHSLLIALLEERGLRRYPTFYEGEGVFHWNGRAHRAGIEHAFERSLLFFRPQELVGLPRADLEQTLALQRRLAELVERVPPQAPWSMEGAAELDRLSVAGWLERQGACALARYPLAWLTRLGGSGGFEPEESSILHLAWTQAVAPQAETPEAWLVEGSISQLAEDLAQELGGLVRLGCPVAAIEQEGREPVEAAAPGQGMPQADPGGDGRERAGAVRVLGADGSLHRAGAVVVAVPPPLRLGIRFQPALPAELRALLMRSPMGSMLKVLAVYRRPFWRDRGLNGLGIGNLPLLELTVDCSPPQGPGLLAGFIAGERAVRWARLTQGEGHRAVLHDLIRLWGPEAGEPMELVLHDWNDEPWSGGAFTSFLSPGAWSRYGHSWQRPHGRVIWAGTEVADRWPGYFEGAIEAGLSAAAQVQRLLG